MTTINATTARKTFYQIISDVNTNNTPITITNKNGENAVLISESDWNAIRETLYLNSVPGYVDSILEGDKEDVEQCKVYNPDEAW